MRARSFLTWAHQNEQCGLQVHVHKCLEDTHGLYAFGVQTYNWIQRRAPWLHHLYFNFLEVVGPCNSKEKMVGIEKFIQVLDKVRPHVILSVHGSLNHGFFEVARDHFGANNIRCGTYCGELFGRYGFSRHWVNPEADFFIGAVEETCEMAKMLGMPAERTHLGGFLLDPSFYEEPISQEHRRKLLVENFNLDPDKFTLLLSTSEMGANNHLPFLNALEKTGLAVQAIVLCGRDERTLEAMKRWGHKHPSLPIRPIPHTSKMASLLQCASAIVARPGTGTTSEAIMCCCPLIFNGVGGIMPQEWITVKYCRQHDIVEAVMRPDELAGVVSKWVHDPSELIRIRKAMAEVRPRMHPTGILDLVSDSTNQSSAVAPWGDRAVGAGKLIPAS